ncbi:MAG: tyrosine-type recombinase/integrase [Thermodesulfobacteriota bacterium]
MGIYQRNGHWYARWRQDGGLVRKAMGPGITTRAQAEAVWRELQKRRLTQQLGLMEPGRLTLGEFSRQFLQERQGGLAASTLDRYRVALKVLADHLGQGYALKSITSRTLSRWVNLRLNQGVTPAAVNADLRHLKAALRRAVKWGLLERAPEVEMAKEPRRLPRHIPPAQLDHILSHERHPERLRLWVFLVWTGCRRSEAAALQWQHITWGKRPAARVIGKGDRERVVPLLPPVVEALGKPLDMGHVFARVHPSTMTKWWRELVALADCKGVRLHDLRHTCFTYLASRGAPLKVIQAIAGHSDIRITMGYARGLVGDIYDAMAEALYPKSGTGPYKPE